MGQCMENIAMKQRVTINQTSRENELLDTPISQNIKTKS